MDQNTNQSIGKIEELVGRVELLPDGYARDAAVELVQAVMALHRDVLERMMEIVAGGAGLRALASDELVSSVLAMHGLHPDDLETRVHRAIEKLQFYFDSRGAGVKLLELEGETVRLRYTSARPGAGSAAKQIIEETIYQAAPEIADVLVEGVEERHESGFVPLADLVATQST